MSNFHIETITCIRRPDMPGTGHRRSARMKVTRGPVVRRASLARARWHSASALSGSGTAHELS
jgi:hypothetical protein